MGKGRPASAETAYKIIIHTNGVYRYASTKQFTTDESGKKVYKYKHWGRLDDSNKFHPGTNYNYASSIERRKLIFPPVCDIHDDSLADCWQSTVQSILNVQLTPAYHHDMLGFDVHICQ
jgi:hypothetical protein